MDLKKIIKYIYKYIFIYIAYIYCVLLYMYHTQFGILSENGGRYPWSFHSIIFQQDRQVILLP